MNLKFQIVRFGLVGLANTAIGYGLILIGLWLGFGDYAANALGYLLGLCFSFFANRKFTFGHQGRPDRAEVWRFMSCFVIAYSGNLAVIALGRALGFDEQPLVHLTAMALYSAIFFVLLRNFTFRHHKR